jgi:hypothetical protein
MVAEPSLINVRALSEARFQERRKKCARARCSGARSIKPLEKRRTRTSEVLLHISGNATYQAEEEAGRLKGLAHAAIGRDYLYRYTRTLAERLEYSHYWH